MRRAAAMIVGSVIALGVLAGPVAALDAVPQDEAEPFVAGDGTEVYCIFDIDSKEDAAIDAGVAKLAEEKGYDPEKFVALTRTLHPTAFQFADCAAVFEGLPSSDEADDEVATDPEEQTPEERAKEIAALDAGPYRKLTKRDWQRLVKAPDRFLRKCYKLFACISQYDAATGEDTFLAQASNERQRLWFTYGDAVVVVSAPSRFRTLVEDDIVKMKVMAYGSLSYDTQRGGNTTVPLFWADSIKRLKGSC